MAKKLKLTAGTTFVEWFEHDFGERPIPLREENDLRQKVQNLRAEADRIERRLSEAWAHDRQREAAYRLWEIQGR